MGGTARRIGQAARRPRGLGALVVVLAWLLASCNGGGGGLPVVYSFPAALARTATHPGASPPGANDFTCRPSAAHPRPVVLVHGTFGNMTDSWNALSPLLKNQGYCVFALNYGTPDLTGQIYGTSDIPASAQQLAGFVDQVLAATGATKVDIVGHSQGGMMPRWYLKFLGGASKTGTLVGLAPSNHGTTLFGLATLASHYSSLSGVIDAGCTACTQQFAGSSFLQQLNSGGDTVPGVSYTVIETTYDEVVTPYTSAFLSGPSVTNVDLQAQCALDGSDHLGIIYDQIALRDVLNALDPAHAVAPACVYVPPAIGG